jgi:hypothetical protein
MDIKQNLIALCAVTGKATDNHPNYPAFQSKMHKSARDVIVYIQANRNNFSDDYMKEITNLCDKILKCCHSKAFQELAESYVNPTEKI